MAKNKHRVIRQAYWGALPWERDGGAVVAYYQYSKLAELRPRWEYYGIPKVPEELNTKALPFMRYATVKDPKQEIPALMAQQKIPVLTTFHIAENIEPLIDSIQLVGGKIVQWQTVHWATDRVFSCKRLNDLDWFVAPTEFAKRLLSTVGGVDPAKITVIPHGVDLGKFYPHNQTAFRSNYGISKEQKVILYAGRLSTWKGVHNIIPAMRKLIRKYDCIFIIRGGYFNEEGKKLHQIFTLLSRRTPNIIYIPQWVPPSFMEELTASADIMLMPSGHEGFQVNNIEAMACGIPTVTTDVPNIREVVGNAGILLQPKEVVGICDEATPIKVPSSKDIEDALIYLLENPEEATLIGEVGLARAKERYDLTKVCKKWIKLYEKLVPPDYDMDDVSAKKLLTL